MNNSIFLKFYNKFKFFPFISVGHGSQRFPFIGGGSSLVYAELIGAGIAETLAALSPRAVDVDVAFGNCIAELKTAPVAKTLATLLPRTVLVNVAFRASCSATLAIAAATLPQLAVGIP